jgi:hypothetical protein
LLFSATPAYSALKSLSLRIPYLSLKSGMLQLEPQQAAEKPLGKDMFGKGTTSVVP